MNIGPTTLTKATLTFSSKLKGEAFEIDPQTNRKKYANNVQLSNLTSNINGRMTGSIFNGGDMIAGKSSNDLKNKLSGQSADFNYGKSLSQTLTFQFNPSTLRIAAYGGGMTPIADYGVDDGDDKNGSESRIRYGPVQSNITVDFKVIFDAETNTDAFMMDRYNVNVSNLAKQGANLFTGDSWRGENNYIRQIVEGFLSTLRNAENRRVTFCWNHLKYSGDLNSVRCNYTMFNPKGEPIRAEVGMSILASGNSKGNGYIGEWKERYEELVKAVDEKGTSSLAGNFFGDSKAFNPINW